MSGALQLSFALVCTRRTLRTLRTYRARPYRLGRAAVRRTSTPTPTRAAPRRAQPGHVDGRADG